MIFHDNILTAEHQSGMVALCQKAELVGKIQQADQI